jgi:hypothetical protein
MRSPQFLPGYPLHCLRKCIFRAFLHPWVAIERQRAHVLYTAGHFFSPTMPFPQKEKGKFPLFSVNGM